MTEAPSEDAAPAADRRPKVIATAVIVAVLALVLVVAAARSQSSSATDPASELVVRTVTEDTDEIQWTTPDAETIVAAAQPGSDGGSLRQVAYRRGVEPSVDQQSCVDWHGPTTTDAQPGIALRIRADGGRTRAITVSDNVWFSARYRWNVHLMDSDASPPIERIGGGPTWSLGRSAYEMAELPWRVCARALGTTIDVKAWSLGAGDPEPSWDDTDATFSVEVPEAWAQAGRPGLYLGHLTEDQRSEFTNLDTRSS